jgi:hypothetical protein
MIPLRRLTLAAIVLNVALIAIRVSSYRQLVAMPGSIPFIAKPLIVLAVYFAVVIWMTSVSGDRAVALSVGTSFGLVTAVVQIIHLLIESFVPTEELVTGITALVFMVGTFLLWAVAGYVAGRRGASVGAAATAGSWAAIVCMLAWRCRLFPFLRQATCRPGRNSGRAAGPTRQRSESPTPSAPHTHTFSSVRL